MKPALGTKINPLNRLNNGLLAELLFNEQGGFFLNDNSLNNNPFELGINPEEPYPTWEPTLWGGGLYVGENENYITRSTGLAIPAGSDYTFFAKVYITSLVGSNPGMWRSGADSEGSDFNIFSGGSYPWIRLDGTDVLNPSSGYTIETDKLLDIAFVVKSSSWAGFYVNGELKHEDTHSTAVPAFSIYNIGYQFSPLERVAGYYDHVRIYTRALEYDEIKQIYIKPNDLYIEDNLELWAWVSTGETLTTADGYKFSDTVGLAVSALMSMSDGVDYSDTLSSGVETSLTLSDGYDFSDAVSQNVTALLSMSDGVYYSDVNQSPASVLSTLTDGYVFADVASLSSISGATMTMADGVTWSDTLGFIASVNLTLADNYTYADGVNAVVDAVLSLSDSYIISDVNSLESGPEGLVKITVSVKQAVFDINIKKPGITVTTKQPIIDVESQC